MRAVTSRPFALGVDTVLSLTAANCAALKSEGIAFAVRYLRGPYAISADELAVILGSGLAVMLVTPAEDFDGLAAVERLRALGVPAGATVWLDLEGCGAMTAAEASGKVNAWSRQVRAGGWDPGLYVGAGVPLSSGQLYGLSADRYWHSCSRVTDSEGFEAGPACGWSMRQLNPYNTQIAGVTVDVDVIEADYRGRLPVWVLAS